MSESEHMIPTHSSSFEEFPSLVVISQAWLVIESFFSLLGFYTMETFFSVGPLGHWVLLLPG